MIKTAAVGWCVFWVALRSVMEPSCELQKRREALFTTYNMVFQRSVARKD